MVWGVTVGASFIVFTSISFMGMVFAVLSSGLLGLWISLELSFFGFIPVLNGKTVAENEGAVKYFIMQSVGSGVLLAGAILVSGEFVSMLGLSLSGWFCDMLVVLGLMVKLGVFPMHFWFPSVMASVSWFSCFWLSVVQKLGPFWAMGGLGVGGWLLGMVGFMVVLTSVVGAVGGLAQVQFRPLLAYSSLGQTGWIGLLSLVQPELFLLYFLLYGLILVGLLTGLNLINSYSLVSVPGWSLSKGLLFWFHSSSFFMSLSGVPPFVGAGLKLMGIFIILNYYPLLLGILIGTSMLSLYYYLTMFISGIVSVGGSQFLIYSEAAFVGKLSIVFIILSMLNWFGGFPLFMLAGSLAY